MVRINLLPQEIKEARQRRKQWRRIITVAGLLAVVFLAVYGYLLADTWTLNRELDGLADHQAGLERQIERYETYEDLEQEVAQTRDRVVRAMGPARDWADVLRLVGVRIPGDVWLTDFRLALTPKADEEEDPTGTVFLQGVTYDHPATAAWLEALQAIERFEQAKVSYSTVQTYRGAELVRFEMSARVLPGEPFDPSLARGDSQ